MKDWLTSILGGGFKKILFSPLPREMIQFDEHILSDGWFNHQLETFSGILSLVMNDFIQQYLSNEKRTWLFRVFRG